MITNNFNPSILFRWSGILLLRVAASFRVRFIAVEASFKLISEKQMCLVDVIMDLKQIVVRTCYDGREPSSPLGRFSSGQSMNIICYFHTRFAATFKDYEFALLQSWYFATGKQLVFFTKCHWNWSDHKGCLFNSKLLHILLFEVLLQISIITVVTI